MLPHMSAQSLDDMSQIGLTKCFYLAITREVPMARLRQFSMVPSAKEKGLALPIASPGVVLVGLHLLQVYAADLFVQRINTIPADDNSTRPIISLACFLSLLVQSGQDQPTPEVPHVAIIQTLPRRCLQPESAFTEVQVTIILDAEVPRPIVGR